MLENWCHKVMPFMCSHRFRYGLHLDSDSSWWGYVSCRITATYVGRSSHTSPLWRSYSSMGYFWFNFDSNSGSPETCMSLTILFCCCSKTGHHNLSYILDADYGRWFETNYDLILRSHLTLEGWIVNIQDAYLISIHACIVPCRSLPDKRVFRVSAMNKLAMFQTFAGMSLLETYFYWCIYLVQNICH